METQASDSTTFIDELEQEMQSLFEKLGDQGALESESDGKLEVIGLLKLAMTSELEASEIAAHWLPTTQEIDAKTVLAEQCADEMRHYNLIYKRLEELGEDMSDFDPLAQGYSPLYQYLRGLRTTIERIAAGPYACEAVAEVRNAQFIEFCRSVGDEETAKLYEDIIHPEEIHHNHMGRDFLLAHATTPEIQEQARSAVRNSLAIADELQILAEMTTGFQNIPVS